MSFFLISADFSGTAFFSFFLVWLINFKAAAAKLPISKVSVDVEKLPDLGESGLRTRLNQVTS